MNPKPLTTTMRVRRYLAQSGRSTLTARQRRRVRHKANRAVAAESVRAERAARFAAKQREAAA